MGKWRKHLEEETREETREETGEGTRKKSGLCKAIKVEICKQ
jgi:hypothetical protein